MGTVAHFNDLRLGVVDALPPLPICHKSAIRIVTEGRFRRPLYGTFAAFPERAGIARHVDGVTR